MPRPGGQSSRAISPEQLLQVAFGVKQKNHADLDAAVSATLELEAYATPKLGGLPVLGVNTEDSEEEESAIGAVNPSNKLSDILKGISERLDKLECSSGGARRPYNCERKGHIARFCQQPSYQPPSHQQQPLSHQQLPYQPPSHQVHSSHWDPTNQRETGNLLREGPSPGGR
jgi:hypothetical protein